MVDTGIFATTAEVQRKTGSGASATSNTEAYINHFMTEAESEINTTCGFNFSDVYTSLNVDTKGILKAWASNLAAIKVIMYDMSGYTSRVEAEDLINVLRDECLRIAAVMKDKKKSDFVREVV